MMLTYHHALQMGKIGNSNANNIESSSCVPDYLLQSAHVLRTCELTFRTTLRPSGLAESAQDHVQ